MDLFDATHDFQIQNLEVQLERNDRNYTFDN
jgi:hypothetical protein